MTNTRLPAAALAALCLLCSQLQAEITSLDPADRALVQALLGDMVSIPGGTFTMGDVSGQGERDEQPPREVRVSPFALGRHEVTFAQYDVFARATGRPLPDDQGWGRQTRPVMRVSWEDARAFAAWLSELTGRAFRLPTEAEWEYAARAGSTGAYHFGDDEARLCAYGNIADRSSDIGWRLEACDDGYRVTAPVGSFEPNAFGLFDMHGNVWEWVQDCWNRNHKGAPADASARLSGRCSKRVQRGGSWFYGAEEARASYRTNGSIGHRGVTVGFRLASGGDT